MAVLYAAAHAQFPDTEPLGGGKAVADYLCRQCPDWVVLSPKSLGLSLRKPLTALGELQYARFCRQFERAATAAIQKHDPQTHVVLANDISEGPDFAGLAASGYRLATIFHVDVVEYFTKFYLRGWVKPATAARWGQCGWLPDVLKLVFQKQAAAVRHSQWLIVPSAPMKEVLLACYPECPPERIHVLPWGNITASVAPLPITFGKEFVVLTLSRLSPEKGIERLLHALQLVRGDLRVWICGAPAYMQGRRYELKLRQLADERVEFLGHVTGGHKAALLARADLFVSPSLHESYGLSIAEAEAAGCPVISHAHHGARGTVVDCADPEALAAAIQDALARGRPAKTASAIGSDAAQKLASLLGPPPDGRAGESPAKQE